MPMPQPQGHTPPSVPPGSAQVGPTRRTAWPGPPQTSCRSPRRCQRPPWPAGKRARGSGGCRSSQPCWPCALSQAPPSQASDPRPHHARSVVGGHGALQTVGTVEDDEASLGRRPQLPEQVGLGGPVPGAEGLQDHTLQGVLQEGPNLQGQDRTGRVSASCSSDSPAGSSALLSWPEAARQPTSLPGC